MKNKNYQKIKTLKKLYFLIWFLPINQYYQTCSIATSFIMRQYKNLSLLILTFMNALIMFFFQNLIITASL
jgi:hypothetical protein